MGEMEEMAWEDVVQFLCLWTWVFVIVIVDGLLLRFNILIRIYSIVIIPDIS